jgi:pimeloyl-ACP methyl ester carboxylesterase
MPLSAVAPEGTRHRPCLVLLPGTLCDERLFERPARALRGRLDVRLESYRDLRHPRRWCEALLRGLPARFAVAGFSLGGLFALELLRQAPERVAGLALVASNGEGASRRGARRSQGLWRLWRRSGAKRVARQVKPAYFHHPAQRRRHARLVQRMAQATPDRAARAQFSFAATRAPGLPLLAALRAPLLVVSGEHDRLCPTALQRRVVQAQPTARWHVLPRCGHFLPLEAPAALSRILADWATRVAAPGPGDRS